MTEKLNKIEQADPSLTEPESGFQQNANGLYCCDLCNKEEATLDDIKTHRILHFANDHSKQCPICQKSFNSSSTLKNHLTVHTGIKKYRCKFCGRKFGWKTQLATHENLHTGKGLHHCDICSKSFMTKWILQRHMKVHNKRIESNVTEPPLKRLAFSEACLNELDFNQGLQETKPRFNNSAQSSNDFERVNQESSNVFCVMHSSPNAPYTCYQCDLKFVSQDKLAIHLLDHNSVNNEKSPIKLADFDNKTDEEVIESLNKTKSNPKIPCKSTLTTIVSKLHHKVDEQQKTDLVDSDNVSVQVIQSTDTPHFVNISLQEGSNEFNQDMQNKTNSVLSKTADPFISGDTLVDKSIPSQHSWTLKQTTSEKMNQNHSKNEISLLRQQLAKQHSLHGMFKRQLEDKCSKNEQEIQSLNKRIDSLTSLVNSQSLLLNRIILGGKMTVSGSLDFAVQQNEFRLEN